ncbi:MAG TPA: site-2 protease family protein [Rhizomicrobium sp.]|nr:site-2 protease family protein [Rhizomicrobium sp.]
MNPALLSQIAIYAVPVIIAITLHEAAHGYVARHFGDHTAADLGRVTLNPLKHVDLFGTVLLPAVLLLSHAGVLFGYAKPVPVKFGALDNPKRDMIWVAAAGPAMNFFLALLSAIILLAALLLGADGKSWTVQLFVVSIAINLGLAILNLLPLPPLDGGRVVTGLLPMRLAIPFSKIERYGMLLIIGMLVLLPMLGQQLGINLDIFNLLVGAPRQYLMNAILGAVVSAAHWLGR